jgi:hypothetical protein
VCAWCVAPVTASRGRCRESAGAAHSSTGISAAGFWVPALRALGLPIVTPHSARHCFISTLQAQGIEVGLVAKLAGHASAVVTLRHYTQAVRGPKAPLRRWSGPSRPRDGKCTGCVCRCFLYRKRQPGEGHGAALREASPYLLSA